MLVLEAGGPDVNAAVESPSRWNEVLLTDLDWAYRSEPQPALGGRRVYSASGRGHVSRSPVTAMPLKTRYCRTSWMALISATTSSRPP